MTRRFGQLGVAVLVVSTACGGPNALAPDAPSGFEFVADYMLDPTIDTATLGSASYVGGQTVHVDLTYTSFDAAGSASPETLQLASGSKTAALTIGPSCPSTCAASQLIPYREVDEWTVIWNAPDAEPEPEGTISCETPTDNCGATS
jgi:hypothetical protein